MAFVVMLARLLLAACIAATALHARAGSNDDPLGLRGDEEVCTPHDRSVPLAARAMDQLKSEPAASVAAPAPKIEAPRSNVAAAIRSAVLPGLGQMYNGQTAKGSAILGTEVALLGTALAFHLSGSSAAGAAGEIRSSGPDASGRAQALADEAAARYRVRDRLLLVGTAVWVLNIADAYFNGGHPIGTPRVDGAFSTTERGLAPLAAIRPGGAVVGLKGRF